MPTVPEEANSVAEAVAPAADWTPEQQQGQATGGWSESSDEWYTGCDSYYGCHFLNAAMPATLQHAHVVEHSKEYSDETFEFSSEMALMSADNRGNRIDLRSEPTYVVMDLGCTKSMGSSMAVEAFMEASFHQGFDCHAGTQ